MSWRLSRKTGVRATIYFGSLRGRKRGRQASGNITCGDPQTLKKGGRKRTQSKTTCNSADEKRAKTPNGQKDRGKKVKRITTLGGSDERKRSRDRIGGLPLINQHRRLNGLGETT